MEKRQDIYRVEGMHCAGCVASVEKALSGIEGVKSAVVNLPMENVKVEYESDISFSVLEETVKMSGYTIIDEPSEDLSQKKAENIYRLQKQFIMIGILGFPLFIIAMMDMMAGSVITLKTIIFQFSLSSFIMLIAFQLYINGFSAMIKRNPNMNSLVALGTGAAYLYSLISSVNIIYNLGISGFSHLYFESIGVILVFITLGRYLEAIATGKTTKALLELLQHAPRTGWIEQDGEWCESAVADICQGDRVMVKPGGQIPVDGVVIEGNSFVDESSITGEPLPVEKNSGHQLTGGTINTSGVLIMEASHIGANTVIARIINMVKEAQNSKAPIQSLADKVASVFVPIVIVCAILSLVGWLLIGESLVFAFNIFISVLIIACPCALGLATPTAMVVGAGLGAQQGIYFKSGEALQKLSEIKSFIFDKTGTLTLGKPRIVDFVAQFNDKDFIYYLASLEKGSEHPLSEAILNLAKIQNINVDACSEVFAIPGKGIQGIIQEKNIQAGSLNWINELGIKIPDTHNKKYTQWEDEGYTIIHALIDGTWMGMAAISDTIRPDAYSTLQALKGRGLMVHLLTGDRQLPGKHLAEQLGIDNVKWELLPQDKAKEVKDIQQSCGRVAMVGDGINDAPALAAADIGIAIGSGTDVALETSDVVLMRDDLTSIIKAFHLTKRVVYKIKQNLFWAFAYNIIGIPIAMGVLYPINGYLLNPILAAAAMGFSSLSVVVNTLLMKIGTQSVFTNKVN